MKRGLAVAAVLAIVGASSAAAATTLTGSATVHFTGAIQRTYHARCEYLAPSGHGPAETTVALFFAFLSKHDADDLQIAQMRPHASVGRVDLRTTRAYRVAFYDTDGRTWGGGWQPGRDLGSGTAVLGARMESGRITATLAGVTEHPAPLHVTVTWNCR
jgi:hypothetical protein